MFEGLRYAWKLRRLKREKQAIHRRASEALKGADPKSDGYNELAQDEIMELEGVRESIAVLRSARLLQLADYHMIEPPPNTIRGNIMQNWVRAETNGMLYLQPHLQEELQQKVRDEQRNRWDSWARWVPLLFGLIGALTGLVSVFRHP